MTDSCDEIHCADLLSNCDQTAVKYCPDRHHFTEDKRTPRIVQVGSRTMRGAVLDQVVSVVSFSACCPCWPDIFLRQSSLANI